MFCTHYSGLVNDACHAGVNYESKRADDRKLPRLDQFPCFCEALPCEKREYEPCIFDRETIEKIRRLCERDLHVCIDPNDRPDALEIIRICDEQLKR